MSLLNQMYKMKLLENEKHLKFWEDYLKNLENLDFQQYTNKLKVPILVPIGNRILFRGELKHTNEVTVALGADYFTKCSVEQADILKQHRIKDAKSKVESLRIEKEFLENQISFTFNNVYEPSNKEIVEFHSEDEDKAWREKHREKVRSYKQSQAKNENKSYEDVTDDELWSRLEELELQEELENEYLSMNNENNEQLEHDIKNQESAKVIENNMAAVEETGDKNCNENTLEQEDTSKLEMLQQVLQRQNDLALKLTELKNKDRNQSKTEQDLISKLDEMEELDELQDEMDRLDDIIEDDIEETVEEVTEEPRVRVQRSVTFADEDNSESLEITFKHSSVEPSVEQYNPALGIIKPSDIYQAFPNSFRDTTSILKKTQYEAGYEKYDEAFKKSSGSNSMIENKISSEDLNNTIIIKDVVEKSVDICNEIEIKELKPVSLFKQRRLKKS